MKLLKALIFSYHGISHTTNLAMYSNAGVISLALCASDTQPLLDDLSLKESVLTVDSWQDSKVNELIDSSANDKIKSLEV